MSPVDWDSPDWGNGRVHLGTTSDDLHTASEDRAEASRG